VVIWAVNKGFSDNIPLNEILKFEEELLRSLSTEGKNILTAINKNKDLSEKEEKEIEKLVKNVLRRLGYESSTN
jgi:F0F1-type ATP synthase alpha subunit